MKADTLRAPDRNGCVYDLEHESGAILDGPAILIRAMIAARTQELIQQISVCTVDLDSIEAGIHSVLRANTVGFDDFRNFVQLQRSRRDIILLRPEQVDMTLWGNRTGSNGQFPVQIGRVGNSPYVPELQHHSSPFRMNRFRDKLPSFDLF